MLIMWTLDSNKITLDAGLDQATLDGKLFGVARVELRKDAVIARLVQKTVSIQTRLNKEVNTGGMNNGV